MGVCDSAQTCASPLLYFRTIMAAPILNSLRIPGVMRGLDSFVERVCKTVDKNCSQRLKFPAKKKKPVAKSA